MSRVFLPRGLEEFFAARRDAPRAPLYAGGTDLLVRLRAQGGAPEELICLERMAELTAIAEQDDTVFIGAAAPVQAVLDHPLVAERFGVLTQALSQLGSPPIRHMATLGGNLVTASPAGDSLPALYCLGAQVDIRWADGKRRAALGDFILGPGRVDLKAGEVVAGVILPAGPEWTLQHFEKVGKRKALAISVASLAACLRLDGDGLVSLGPFGLGQRGAHRGHLPAGGTGPGRKAPGPGRPARRRRPGPGSGEPHRRSSGHGLLPARRGRQPVAAPGRGLNRTIFHEPDRHDLHPRIPDPELDILPGLLQHRGLLPVQPVPEPPFDGS